jgi:hypothetical protein
MYIPWAIFSFIEKIQHKPLGEDFSTEFFSCIIQSIIMVIPCSNNLQILVNNNDTRFSTLHKFHRFVDIPKHNKFGKYYSLVPS